MDCGQIPSKKAREAIRRTEETGKEHGFVICPDGSTGEIQAGGRTSLRLKGECESEGQVAIFHTHPNGNMNLSDQDRRVLSHDKIGMVCAGNASSDDAAYRCERQSPSCVKEL